MLGGFAEPVRCLGSRRAAVWSSGCFVLTIGESSKIINFSSNFLISRDTQHPEIFDFTENFKRLVFVSVRAYFSQSLVGIAFGMLMLALIVSKVIILIADSINWSPASNRDSIF